MKKTARDPLRSPWPSEADREKARGSKKEAVLETAVKFFNAKGFHATSLDDVALALNVTKPTIYHYFSNKDEILFECVKHGLAELRNEIERAEAHGGSGMDRLRMVLRNYARCMMQDFGICVIRTPDTELSPESRAKFRELKRAIDLNIRQLVANGMADGSIAKGDQRIVTYTLTGGLNWIARWYDPEGVLTADEIADGVVSTLLNGLDPRPPAGGQVGRGSGSPL